VTEHDTRISFRYLSEPDMIAAGVTDMARCVEAMEETLALVNSGDFRMGGPDGSSHGSMITFPSTSPHEGMPLDGPHRRFMAMPAYLGGSFQTAGCKWYGSNLGNRDRGLPRSILMFTLSDKETGAPLAIMSANLLSAYRTGAIPGVCAKHLARSGARSVGIVAPGVMNRTSLEAFVAVCPDLDTLKVAGRSQRGIDAFVEWVRTAFPQFTSVTVVGSVEAAVRDSDLVSIAPTTPAGSENYVRLERGWVKPGALVCLPADIMIDDALLYEARHVADFRGLYETWEEELPAPAHEYVGLHGLYVLDRIREGRVPPGKLENLPSIMAGTAPGRADDEEVFLLSIGGMPVEDVAWGTVVHRTAVERGVGTLLDLWDSPALA
jgi:N-[(2S)-2-amino-2-carboxyethyl]-L-glutamate dehydrogenase